MTGTTRIPVAEITGFTGMAGVGGKVQKWDACDEQLKSFAHMAVAAQAAARAWSVGLRRGNDRDRNGGDRRGGGVAASPAR